LTTGCRPRRLSLPGADKANVHYLRTVDDVNRLQRQFLPDRRLVIIGGGYIGLEVAAVAIKMGLHVTVVETLQRVLTRVTAPEISAFYERVHREHGVDLRTGVGVHAIQGDTDVRTLVLTDGTKLPADLVVVGIGAIPNSELAEAAGLEVSNGIVVDRHAVTSDPDIVAAGDCTQHENVFLGRRLRLESVANALEQSRVAAGSMLGKLRAYEAVPWFWSDQYDLKLQMVGLSAGYDRLIVRGDLEGGCFSAFYARDGVVIAVDAINRPQDFVVARKLVGERAVADPQRLADMSFPLKLLLKSAA
jgi:3-phenylpropionate/trans-cinnamate dioxygenase ferredoxin reductase component